MCRKKTKYTDAGMMNMIMAWRGREILSGPCKPTLAMVWSAKLMSSLDHQHFQHVPRVEDQEPVSIIEHGWQTDASTRMARVSHIIICLYPVPSWNLLDNK